MAVRRVPRSCLAHPTQRLRMHASCACGEETGRAVKIDRITMRFIREQGETVVNNGRGLVALATDPVKDAAVVREHLARHAEAVRAALAEIDRVIKP